MAEELFIDLCIDSSIPMDGNLGRNSWKDELASWIAESSPWTDYFASMTADPEPPMLQPPPSHDSIEPTPMIEEGNPTPTCVQVENTETAVRSPDLDPSDADHQCVEQARKIKAAQNWPIENEKLLLQPHLIPAAAGHSLLPGKVFMVDDVELLASNTVGPLPNGSGSWKRVSLGYGVKRQDGAAFIAFKITYEFRGENKSRTNWIMDLYGLFDRDFFVEGKYMCHVFQFQGNEYDPCPRYRPFMPTGDENCDPNAACPSVSKTTENRYPNAAGPSECRASGNWYPKAAGPSAWKTNENWYPNAAGHSTGMPSENYHANTAWPSAEITRGMKKRKGSTSSVVWSNYTEITASSGPNGEVLRLCLCNHCGMAYKKTSGTGTLANHKCNNH